MVADRLDIMFRAFADRTRLRLLNLLRGGEVCVGDLVEVVAAPQPTVSRHLAYLRRAGLALVAREGNRCFYRLAPAATDFHARLLDCLGCCLGEAPQLRKDAAVLARLRKSGGCCTREGAVAERMVAEERACCR
jgi:ArsR family transcriptional regulator, arsenate/arsenite/antimonite-responsive transcriptional repressor